MIFSSKAKEEFNVKPVTSNEMLNHVSKCAKIYEGKPDWLDEENHIKTINFAKAICEETGKLTTLGIGIKIDGSLRANWLQEQIDKVYYQLRSWVEYGCAYGTVILKPNGTSIDLLKPSEFMITDTVNGTINGIVFLNKDISNDGKKFFTRLEYHRFVNDIYMITNKCYVGDSANDLGKDVPIEETPWNGLREEVGVTGLDKPLYAVLSMPTANNIDIDSPLGLPRFSEALEELKDLDIAYSRNVEEIYDSSRIVLMDSDKLLVPRGLSAMELGTWEVAKDNMKLPKFVRNVTGYEKESYYQEINPNLNTEMRLSGINSLLSQIGFKCGFSNGYFVFNEKTGMVTATQVESDDRRTIQTIKDIRDALESCLTDLIYALDKFASLYNLAPLGRYEVVFDFGDITYNREEDRQRWWGYVQAGKVPAWKYFEKFEGLTEDEAKAMTSEAQESENLFEVE